MPFRSGQPTFSTMIPMCGFVEATMPEATHEEKLQASFEFWRYGVMTNRGRCAASALLELTKSTHVLLPAPTGRNWMP